MKILKCDNCGAYFDFGTRDEINRISVQHDFRSNLDVLVLKSFHICPDCLNAVKMTLKYRKAEAKYNSNRMEDDLK